MVQRYDCRGAVVTHETGPFVLYEDYEALRKIASLLMENLSDDAELPHETVELMMDLGVFND